MKRSIFALVLMAMACNTHFSAMETSTDPKRNVLVDLLQQEPAMQPYLQQRDSLRLQVIYTQIDRDGRNRPRFNDYAFHANADEYFYPASTVKMPIAFLALEKLRQLQSMGIDRNTTMITDSSFTDEVVAYTQPTAADSRATVAHYIKQIFLVSDNDAFNRLYEWLGQEYIQRSLQEKGYRHSSIRHRLAVVLTPEQNRHTNPVRFLDTAGNVLHEQPAQVSQAIFPKKDIRLGQGHYSGGKLVRAPFDFSLKNNVALADLHQQLRALVFPDAVPAQQRYNISDDDRSFLLRYMSSFPRESRYPYYDSSHYTDDYAKFFGKSLWPNKNIRIFSKAGWAYGFLTDVAYVIDLEHNIEFMVSATILCNKDGIFNDDHYDFETTGYPFMQALGEMLYRHEIKRKRSHTPDLASFPFNYTTE